MFPRVQLRLGSDRKSSGLSGPVSAVLQPRPLFALQIGGNNPPFVKNFHNPNGRFLDSLTVPSAPGSAFGTGFAGASVGGETSPHMPNSLAVEPDCSA